MKKIELRLYDNCERCEEELSKLMDAIVALPIDHSKGIRLMISKEENDGKVHLMYSEKMKWEKNEWREDK